MASREPDTGRPFADLFSAPETEEEQVDVSGRPFADLFTPGGIRPSEFARTETASLERFSEGVGRGFVHPVKGLLPDIGESEGIAGTVGEFVGAGLSFVPLFKGAQAVAKGIGLTKSASLLGRHTTFIRGMRTPLGVRGARAAEGALAFAGFESFSGPVDETPGRVAMGLVEGAAFELAAIKGAALWRARHPKWTYKPVGRTRAEIQEANIHPYALKVERWYSQPGESFNQTAAKLKAIEDQGEQLNQAFERIKNTFMPGANAVLPSVHIDDVDDVVRTARQVGMKTSVFKQADDTFEVFVVDPSQDIMKATAKAQRAGASREDIVAAALKDFDDLAFEFPESISGAFGNYSPRAPTSVVRAATEHPEEYLLTTLTHEIQHHVTRSVSMREGQGLDRLTEVFNLNRHIAGEREGIKRVRDELRKVTEEVLTWQEQIVNGLDPSAARRTALRRIESNKSYYHSDTELLSRMTQFMFIDMNGAREVAPRASRLVGGLLVRESPAVRGLLSDQAKATYDRIRSMWIEHIGRSGDDAVTVFMKGKPEFGADDLKAFAKNGFAPGMRVVAEGRPAEYVRRQGALGVVRFLDTRKTAFKQEFRIQKPLLPDILKREKQVVSAVDDMLARKARNEIDDVAVNLLDPDGNVLRSVVNTREMDKAKSLRAWRQGFSDEEQVLWDEVVDASQVDFYSRVFGESFDEDMIRDWRVMKSRGVNGVLLNDEGFMEIRLSEFGYEDAIAFAGQTESQAFGSTIAGKVRQITEDIDPAVGELGGPEDIPDLILNPSLDDQLKLWLRKEGTPEEDIGYFFNLAKERLGNRLDNLMDAETRQLKENGAVAANQLEDDLQAVAARTRMSIDDVKPDEVIVRDQSSDAVVGRFTSREAAEEFIRKSGPVEDAIDLVDTPNGAGAGGGGNPPKFQQQFPQGPEDLPYRELGKGGGLVDATTMFGSLWTAIENFAKTAERKGFGPVYTRVFLPTQRAILEVDRQLAEVPRDLLGGRTISEQLERIAGNVNKVKKDRQEIVTRWVEYMSKEEIARTGGLLQRGMNDNEIRVARMIEVMGLGNDVPRLMSADRLIRSSLKSEAAIKRRVRELKRVRGSTERDRLLEFFESFPTFETYDDAAKALGLTSDELKVIDIINKSKGAGKDEFSIFAVSRYASAKPLGKGFKNGREQFAVEQGMTKAELEAGKQIDELMNWAFTESGLDAKRQIGGYWPHMRTWAQYGYSPRNVPGLTDDMVEWSHAKFRSGELDVYNMDPLQTSYKYVRSLLMNRHFDPLIPGIKKHLDEVADISPRVKRIMDEYVHELQGRPHESFRKLQGAVEEGWKAMTGKLPKENLVRDIANGLSALAASAAIPFRPAIILRNYYESLQKIAPRVGLGYYTRALKFVTNKATRKQAWQMAKEAQAISPGPQRIKSIHASTELFGPGVGKFNHKLESLLSKGFEWYQSADDWGRAIAYHAQRMRILDHHGAWMKKGGGRGAHFEKFLEDAKVLTFDPIDVRIAEEQFLRGDVDAAIRHLGFTLSRETMNRYGHANHPAGWNHMFGRLFGQFGTWPVQYKDYLAQGLTRGTAKDRAEFAAIHFGTMAGTLAGGTAVGLNLSTWVGFPSLTYTGGPYADLAIDITKSISGSDAERALARRNLYSQIPVLGWMETGRPESLFVPGSYLLGDIASGIQADTPMDALLEATGFSVLRPEQLSAFDWLSQ